MNNHYATYLERKYEPLYSGQYGGFAVGDGWFDIINHLSRTMCSKWLVAKEEYEFTLTSGTTYWGKNSTPEILAELKGRVEVAYQAVPRVQQVKEKFGTLRFYTTSIDERQNAAIAFAESLSGHICEVCGDRGRRRSTGWIQTLCNTHFQLHKKRQQEEYGDC
jgi:hypothetical protein